MEGKRDRETGQVITRERELLIDSEQEREGGRERRERGRGEIDRERGFFGREEG